VFENEKRACTWPLCAFDIGFQAFDQPVFNQKSPLNLIFSQYMRTSTLVRSRCPEINFLHTWRVDFPNKIRKEAFTISQTLLSQDSLLAGSHIFARVILGRKFGLNGKPEYTLVSNNKANINT
jgi:hypothetical protein